MKGVGLVYLFLRRLAWQGGAAPEGPKMQVSGVSLAQPPVPETLVGKEGQNEPGELQPFPSGQFLLKSFQATTRNTAALECQDRAPGKHKLTRLRGGS